MNRQEILEGLEIVEKMHKGELAFMSDQQMAAVVSEAIKFINLVPDEVSEMTEQLTKFVHREVSQIPEEPHKIDEWVINGLAAELWVVKGKLQVRYGGTIHNIPLERIAEEKAREEIEPCHAFS